MFLAIRVLFDVCDIIIFILIIGISLYFYTFIFSLSFLGLIDVPLPQILFPFHPSNPINEIVLAQLVLNLGHTPLYRHFYKCLNIELLKILLVY